MKAFLILALGLAAAAAAVNAQKPDTSQLEIHYKFAHVRDTNDRGHPYTENMVLLAGKRSSVYKSNDRHTEVRTSPNPDGTTRTDSHSFGSPVEYYQYPNERRLMRKDNILFTEFIIADALPAIDWHITGDTATLRGLPCQKATAHFKGRNYIAWFCPSLPLHTGPWKLNGLPGIIVEAHDLKDDVRFTFDGIAKPAPTAILPPDKGVRTTDREFARLRETADKDPQAFINGMGDGGGPAGNGRTVRKIDVKPGTGPVINNPIELPETK